MLIRERGSNADFREVEDDGDGCEWCAARPPDFDEDRPRRLELENDKGETRLIVREQPTPIKRYWTRCFKQGNY